MAVRWTAWQSELEALPVFAEEWSDGLPEDFVRNVQGIVVRKRAQREAIQTLAGEVQRVHDTYQQLLAFFDLERACQRWSAANCPDEAVDRVLAALGEWRERLTRYSGKFPPSDAEMRSYAAMQACIREAQSAADLIRAGFGALDAYLAPRVAGTEKSAAEPALEEAAPQADPVPVAESAPAAEAAPVAAAPVPETAAVTGVSLWPARTAPLTRSFRVQFLPYREIRR